MKRRPYVPTETHLALHPDSGLLTCSCGVRFSPRPDAGEDDPDRCLTCNRKAWSIRFGAVSRVEEMLASPSGSKPQRAPVLDMQPRRADGRR